MGILEILGKIVLSIFALLLIVDLSTWVIMTSVKDNLMSPSFYTGVADKNGIYTKIQTTIPDLLANNMPDLPAMLTKEDVKNVLKDAITVQEVKTQLNGIINNGIIYLTTDVSKPNLSISLTNLKPKILASLNATIQSKLPQSNVSSNVSLGDILPSLMSKSGSLDMNVILAYCQTNPTDADCIAAVSLISTPENQAALIVPILDSVVPDSFDLYAQMDIQTKAQLANAKTMVKQANLGLTIILGFAVALVVLMVIITRNLKGICRWVGFPLFMTGLGLVVAGLFVPGMAMKAISGGMFTGWKAADAVFAQNVILDVLRTIFGTIMTNGLIICAIGLVLLIASFILKSNSGKAEVKAETKTETKKKK